MTAPSPCCTPNIAARGVFNYLFRCVWSVRRAHARCATPGTPGTPETPNTPAPDTPARIPGTPDRRTPNLNFSFSFIFFSFIFFFSVLSFLLYLFFSFFLNSSVLGHKSGMPTAGTGGHRPPHPFLWGFAVVHVKSLAPCAWVVRVSHTCDRAAIMGRAGVGLAFSSRRASTAGRAAAYAARPEVLPRPRWSGASGGCPGDSRRNCRA